MEVLVRDIRDAIRSLTGRPVLALAAVGTMAIAIGGATALVALASALLRPATATTGMRLVRIFAVDDDAPFGVGSFANFEDLAARTRTVARLAIHQQTFAASGLGDETASVAIELVSAAYFPVMGVEAASGRLLEDADASGARVVVVSDRWWRTQRGADPAAVGGVLHLNGVPFTVVGVAPPAFRGAYDTLGTDVWAPLMTYDIVRPRGLDIRRRTWGWLQATGLLTDTATVEDARSEIATIAAALRQEYPRENDGLAFTVVPASALPESLVAPVRRGLAFAIIVAVLALVAACTNVANAALAAVSDRASEIAVRVALGASPRDIARQWLVQSLLTATVATAVGLLLALWIRDAVLAIPPPTGLENLRPDVPMSWAVWGGAAALTTLATCLSGVWPAYRASRVSPAQPLRDGAATNVGGGVSWMRPALVSAQAGVALALVAVSAILGQSLATARWLDLGFDRGGLVVATANVSGLGHDAAQSFEYHADAMARLRAIPGAKAVTAASVVPLGSNDERRGITIDGFTPAGTSSVSTATNIVWPGYFEVMGIPIVAGRAFADDDGRRGAPPVAVVNQTMARRYWTAGNAVGQTIRLGATTVEVVGVAMDSTYYAIGEAPLPYLYLAHGPSQPDRDGLTFLARTAVAPEVMVRQMIRELRARDPRVRVANAMGYDSLRAAALLPLRVLGWLSAGFGVMALALLLVGTYGVTAHLVSTRRRELALRLALGAAPKALRASVVRRALVWSVPGAAAGLAMAVALGQLLRGFLVGVTPAAPAGLGLALAAVVVVTALAAWVPARRVGGNDVATELRR